MELWTAQMSMWRRLKKEGVEFIDATVLTGNSIFAPTWMMVRDYKDGILSEKEYTELYLELMRASYSSNEEAWLNILKPSRVAIACYCPAGEFCHRHLLIECLKAVANKHGITVDFKGEWLK